MLEYKGYYITKRKDKFIIYTIDNELYSKFDSVNKAKKFIDKLDNERKYLYEKLYR